MRLINQHRRLGRFRIADIDANMREAKLVLADLVVVRAEMLYECNGIEYTAIGDCFPPVEEGAIVPMYLPILYYDGMGGVRLKEWQKI